MIKLRILYSGVFLLSIIGLTVLFYLPYRAVKEKTIDAFNKEQLILAGQASVGIENTFAQYSKPLRHFAASDHIIRMQPTARHDLSNFYTVHTPEMLSLARLNTGGEILFKMSDSKIIADDLLQETYSLIPLPESPTVREIFHRNRKMVAFTCPVYNDIDPAGSMVILFSFDQLAEQFLTPLKNLPGRRIWLINRQGEVLDFSDPLTAGKIPSTGKSAGSSLLPAIQKMAMEKTGAGTFVLVDKSETGAAAINHVVFMPVRLPGENRWSIAVATSEEQVLANMHSFRRVWLLVSTIALGILFGLSYFFVRSLILSAEKKKRERMQDQLIELMDLTPMGIIVYDIHGYLQYANRTAKEMWRQNTSMMIEGLNIFDIIHPDYKNFLSQRFKDVLRGGTTEPAIIKIILPGNREKSIEISTAPLEFSGRRCGISVIQDVSERMKAEEEQRRLATAIAYTNDSILITDRSGTIEYINPAFSRISGYGREEVIGMNPRILKSGFHNQAFYEEMWKILLQGQVWEGRLVNRRKDGTLYTEFASISPVLDMNDKITHFVAVKRDITHEIELESQLQQAQKMEAIGTLAGGIAHDFNNILGAIIGFTELSLLQIKSDSPVYENLQHIRSSGKRAADLIQQILTFSRQAATTEKSPVAVAPLLKETLKLLRASIPVTIKIRFALNEPEGWVLADPVQIQQVIMNLCTNAFHAMSEKGGVLTISLTRLSPEECRRIDAPLVSSCLELKVADTGHGIEKSILERIFDPFFTTKEPGVGTGMGLSVVHGIVKELNGTIQVDSGPAGTCFTILLPETGRQAVQQMVEKDIPRGKESILVVDDEAGIRITCRMMLEQLGYRVTVNENPLHSLELIKDPENIFDLVLSDQTMPEMTGTRLLEEIRKYRPDLPVILCTGYSEQLPEEAALAMGAKMLLRKPFNFRKLAESIRKVLDNANAGSSSPEKTPPA